MSDDLPKGVNFLGGGMFEVEIPNPAKMMQEIKDLQRVMPFLPHFQKLEAKIDCLSQEVARMHHLLEKLIAFQVVSRTLGPEEADKMLGLVIVPALKEDG